MRRAILSSIRLQACQSPSVLRAAASAVESTSNQMPVTCAIIRSEGETSVTPACQISSVSVRGFASDGLILDRKKRFYKSVQIQEVHTKHGKGYQVLLDSRPIKTPAKHTLVLPSQALAYAIAAEWEWQITGKPQMHTMPLMSIAVTAIDQPKHRDKVIEHLLKYVTTDAVCCRMEEGSAVAALQAQMHDPLLRWAACELGWRLVASHSVYGPDQSEAALSAVKAMLQGLGPFHLAAMEQAVTSCKSVVIAAALLHGRLRVDEAFRAARVEEDAQLAAWGRVEAGHDLDEADIGTRVAAPSLFVRLMAGLPTSV